MSERLDAVNERLDQVRYNMKLEILSTPVSVMLSIPSVHGKKGHRFWQMIGQLTNQGIELQGGKYHEDLPEQTLDVVKELASLVENAVEDYLNNGE